MMVNQKQAYVCAMAMGVSLFRGIHSAHRRLRFILQRCERGFIQNRDDPPIRLHFFRGKHLPVAAAILFRELL